LAHHGIRVIIDLRTEEERQRHPYDSEAIADVEYVHCPARIGELSDMSSLRGSLYYPAYLAHKESFIQALRFYYASAPKPVLVHCIYGCDRTGILCALIGLLAQVPADRIVAEYAKSAGADGPESMELFLNQVGDRASLMKELEPFGITEELLERRN
jgi:protein tyrosine/serine phosphatase